MPAYVVVFVIVFKNQWSFTVNFTAYVKGGAPLVANGFTESESPF